VGCGRGKALLPQAAHLDFPHGPCRLAFLILQRGSPVKPSKGSSRARDQRVNYFLPSVARPLLSSARPIRPPLIPALRRSSPPASAAQPPVQGRLPGDRRPTSTDGGFSLGPPASRVGFSPQPSWRWRRLQEAKVIAVLLAVESDVPALGGAFFFIFRAASCSQG
jgi:hypothetical protein